MASASQTTHAYPKRKRAEVKYYESDDDSDGYISDDEEPTKKKRMGQNAKPVPTKKPLPKNKIFPFMRLPAELRNQIYELTLTDENGISLISKTRQYRRNVIRDVPSFINSSSYRYRRRRQYGYRWNSNASDDSSASAKLAGLVPNFLLLNHEIHTETQPILYASNSFFFEDTTAMHTFLTTVGPQNRATLVDLTLKGWGDSRAHKTMNHPAFTALADAVNLEHLHIDCQVYYGGGPIRTARQLYREGFHFLQSFGTGRKKFDAAVEIIEIREENLNTWGHYGDRTPKPNHEQRLEEFRGELRRLLKTN